MHILRINLSIIIGSLSFEPCARQMVGLWTHGAKCLPHKRIKRSEEEKILLTQPYTLRRCAIIPVGLISVRVAQIPLLFLSKTAHTTSLRGPETGPAVHRDAQNEEIWLVRQHLAAHYRPLMTPPRVQERGQIFCRLRETHMSSER